MDSSTPTDDWHTVPVFDHREKTKYKPSDKVQTIYGPARVINTAVTPMGNLYRVEALQNGSVMDLFEPDLLGKLQATFVATARPEDGWTKARQRPPVERKSLQSVRPHRAPQARTTRP